MLVYLILLVYRHPDETVNRLMIHPGYDASPPNRLGAFNTVTADGRRWLAATCDFLASRWSDPAALHGRAVGYIVGNEVNSHWFWSNRGRTSLAEFAADYEPAVRIVHESVRRHAAWGRVYLSLEITGTSGTRRPTTVRLLRPGRSSRSLPGWHASGVTSAGMSPSIPILRTCSNRGSGTTARRPIPTTRPGSLSETSPC